MFWKRSNQTGNGQQTGGRYQNSHAELIYVKQVVKNFDTAAGKFTALKGVDLRVDGGEFVAVIGKSGSGKSTLINMIAGIDRPTSGEVLIGETAVHKLNEGQMAVWRGKNLGIVFQFFQLLPMLTLIENIMLPMDFCNAYKPNERRSRAMALLEQMEMAEHAAKLPSAISGGQQQRVAIARALANDPPIILADEPTGNLDSKTAESVFKLFQDLTQQGKTILMVTHDNDLSRRATRSVQIVDGEVIEQQLAITFPSLSHAHLVALTHQINPDKYQPGEIILRQGAPVESLHVINKGLVEVVVAEPSGAQRIVATLKHSDYFGEIELLKGGTSVATVRAAGNSTVELLRLGRDAFREMVEQSTEFKASITRVMQTRIAENLAMHGGMAV